MKRILTICIITTSSLLGDVACDLVEPKFDAVSIDSPNLILSLKHLEEKAQAIYEPYDQEVSLNIFDLSKKEEKRIEYSASNVSLLGAATALLEQSKADFYATRSGVIWIGVTEKRIKELEARYPTRLKETLLPQVNITDASITDVEKAIASLWSAYSHEEMSWKIRIFRRSNEKINIQMNYIDVMSLVVYLDLLNEKRSNQAGDDNSVTASPPLRASP